LTRKSTPWDADVKILIRSLAASPAPPPHAIGAFYRVLTVILLPATCCRATYLPCAAATPRPPVAGCGTDVSVGTAASLPTYRHLATYLPTPRYLPTDTCYLPTDTSLPHSATLPLPPHQYHGHIRTPPAISEPTAPLQGNGHRWKRFDGVGCGGACAPTAAGKCFISAPNACHGPTHGE